MINGLDLPKKKIWQGPKSDHAIPSLQRISPSQSNFFFLNLINRAGWIKYRLVTRSGSYYHMLERQTSISTLFFFKFYPYYHIISQSFDIYCTSKTSNTSKIDFNLDQSSSQSNWCRIQSDLHNWKSQTMNWERRDSNLILS